MNTFMEVLKAVDNYKTTENGGVAYKSTLNKVMDLFAFGGAYRSRSDEDCILLFKEAFDENPVLALKCLFYLRDVRGGQGERRFFRVCYHWLAQKYPNVARRNLVHIAEYGRFDDALYACADTSLEVAVFELIKAQLAADIQTETPSLLAKWLPSCNASSAKTRAMGNKVREYIGATQKEYRKLLSHLRKKINVLEKTMSANKWDEIDFSKIPSKAGLRYRNAFATREETKERYAEFAKSDDTKVNAGTLYPYEIIYNAVRSRFYPIDDPQRKMMNKYWENLPDYFDGKESNMLCVVDTSGSMTGGGASAPINVAISLGIYAAERAGGPFKDHYISFSSRPSLVEVKGLDITDKARRIYESCIIDNTDLTAVFELLLAIADRPDTKEEDIPKSIVVISDMEIDYMTDWRGDAVLTEMEKVRQKWAAHGHKLPRLVYWNVDARSNTILDKGDNVSFVSGMSPSIFKQVITGKSGIDLMLETLLDDRYKVISV